MSSIDLYQFRSNSHSQWGEDGILEKLINTIGLGKGFFVEFGAWDGEHLSNCRALVDKHWDGCYIEADERRFRQLQQNLPQVNIKKINALVETAGPNSLSSILGRNGITRIDLLSIDIDSDDLAVWQSIEGFRPTIVVIEYNPTIPFDTRYVNEHGRNFGNAALSIVEFGISQNFKLVAGTVTNLVFLCNEADPAGLIDPKSLQQIRDQLPFARYFFGYDGTLLTEPSTLREHGITELLPIPWSNLPAAQPIPSWLRGFGDERSLRSLFRTVFVAGFVFLRSPFQLFKLWFRLRAKHREKNSAAGTSTLPECVVKPRT